MNLLLQFQDGCELVPDADAAVRPVRVSGGGRGRAPVRAGRGQGVRVVGGGAGRAADRGALRPPFAHLPLLHLEGQVRSVLSRVSRAPLTPLSDAGRTTRRPTPRDGWRTASGGPRTPRSPTTSTSFVSFSPPVCFSRFFSILYNLFVRSRMVEALLGQVAETHWPQSGGFRVPRCPNQSPDATE